MARAVHAMMRVLNLQRSVEFYSRAFGLSVVDKLEFDAFTLVYLRNAEAEFEIELAWSKGRTEPYRTDIECGHLAFSVGDLHAEHQRFVEAGYAPSDVAEYRRDGAVVARFFFVEDPDGNRIELLERRGRYH